MLPLEHYEVFISLSQKNKRTDRSQKVRLYPLWKAVLLCALPLAVIYQASWSLYFSSVALEFWMTDFSTKILTVKHTGEVLLYVFIFWAMLTKTSAKKKYTKPLVLGVVGVILCMTLHVLIWPDFPA
ncbi:hypothetical protein S4054249_14020 [Pseudoalteromonas luteoviolacea]|uniref:Uncharacterized protein n=1 Tax=Pseudoalteromonas luteoviolacea S4054 TaxID=1129367 RepID=A0A0F6A6I3_9GAMM|nr:hypothetical protein S4054249_14020 [Pseudoalteromonas luteoviolacea]AOT13818.1 hypothetical protein S40542_13990 [Pseudoalteromonas luteoviolacea]AOT18733.1 hypothetical protein S4054_13995 [Pseudoalteromonas luteoviolacea]KKE81733.1 hypothetical protein N479_21120 [Pseudoalteromonas luteoviolacea S4054]KZN68033.1 hypothetical protein N481_23620 [Pseudoalteromonas luteoviolacea S4047-1]